MNEQDFWKVDSQLRADFGLGAYTTVLVPIVEDRKFGLLFRRLSEDQARAILRAAVESGVDLVNNDKNPE